MSVKPRQPKPATSHTDSLLKEGSTAEMTQQANAKLRLSPSYPYSRGARLLTGVKRGALLAPKEVVIKQYFIFVGFPV